MKHTALAAIVSAFLVATASAQEAGGTQPAKPQQPPTFRTGVDLVMVDVGVSDERGRPVTDLLPPDFVVKIDGEVRKVVSADHVRIDVEAARKQAAAEKVTETFFTSNLTPPNGRMIVLAVDQSNIRPGAARPLLDTASKFLDRLSPADKVAFIAFPEPGEAVDFTNDHARIRRSMVRVTGVYSRHKGRFNIGMWEARMIVESRDEITRRTVVARECGMMQGFELERCERDIELESADIVSAQRLETTMALRGLTDLLRNLTLVEGPKTLILLSEGLVLENVGGELDDIVRYAALGRVSINVLLMEVPRFDVSQSQLPPSASEDRNMQVQGLETLASFSRGALYRVIGTGESIFDRLASEISAYYLLGVEQAARDRDGKRHRIDVEVRRRNVSVRSRRAFVMSTALGPEAKAEDRLVSALKNPFAVAEVPLRVTSYAYQDKNPEKVRIVLAAEVGQPGAAAAEYTVGYVLVDDRGGVASSGQDKRRLEPIVEGGNTPLLFLASLTIDPGNYHVRLGVVDAEGRRGSVIRDVHAWKTSGEAFSVGDLMLGSVEVDRPIRPQVEPRVGDGVLAAYLELYASSPAAFGDAVVKVEIADGEDGTALTGAAAEIVAAGSDGARAARAIVPAGMLPPGRYVARARITLGGKPAGVLVRPFVLAGGSAAAGGGTATPTTVIVPAPKFDRAALMAPEVMTATLDMVQQTSPALKDALAAARAGKFGPAALEALSAGDQPAAAFFRGLDLLTRGDDEKAGVQLNIAAGPRREYFPAAFFLGVLFASAGRDADAAGVWHLSLGTTPKPAFVYAALADARLRAGQPAAAIDVLVSAVERAPADDGLKRRLAMAYAGAGRHAEAAPMLDAYLAKHPSDADALLAAVLAHYQVASRANVSLSDVERAKLTRYARAYKGPQEALIAKYLDALQVR